MFLVLFIEVVIIPIFLEHTELMSCYRIGLNIVTKLAIK